MAQPRKTVEDLILNVFIDGDEQQAASLYRLVQAVAKRRNLAGKESGKPKARRGRPPQAVIQVAKEATT